MARVGEVSGFALLTLPTCGWFGGWGGKGKCANRVVGCPATKNCAGVVCGGWCLKSCRLPAKKSTELAVVTCVFVHALLSCAKLSGYCGVVYGAWCLVAHFFVLVKKSKAQMSNEKLSKKDEVAPCY